MGIDCVQRSSLREKQRQERLELLLQAAEQMFEEKGYRDTSMDEIAARVGIGTATIYSHFSSKEDLMVAAIFEGTFRRIVQGVEEIGSSEASATEKLTRVFDFLVSSDFFRRRVQIWYAMGDSPETQKALITRQEAISVSTHAFSDALAAMIEQGKAAGEFQQEIATSTMLRAFIGLTRAQSVTDRLLGDYEAFPDTVLQVFLQGIVKRAE